MRLQTILPGLFFATAAIVSFGAFPADGADRTKSADVQTSQPVPQAMMSHSHMDGKGGMAQQMAAMAPTQVTAAKPKAGQDKSKHYHPRDGK